MVKRICLDGAVEHMMQFVSVDAYGKKAEYIRNGLDFNRMLDNVDEFLERIPVRNSVTFIITYNNLSVTSLSDLLRDIKLLREKFSQTYQRVWFDIPLLRQPAWQQIALLPESYQEIHKKNIEYMREYSGPEEGFDGFKDFEIQKMLRNLAVWRNEKTDLTQEKSDFYAFFTEHDRRRGTNFLTIFPEMEEFWTECRSLWQN